eukprot:CAMPEP_0117003284 /NCGR_PEP_ID=MMETSP0472-20121206/4652_1 /TAXON_ID=693140 ORGANISM="Tiarina fusus, Strain LIS" /NCGR_SAMPLE_ID=MMETSP0472 /ASSEMBLY_ACC=CAM_ASM_000603 /LENGTH=125 /DNA_ID=CAMNT_0004703875 /DNA_START=26 /DNA_END=400 /DNA_ORIENTATION=+
MSTFLAFRLLPDEDLLEQMNEKVKESKIQAAALVTCVGSLYKCNVRLAEAKETALWEEELEIVSLVGTFSQNGPHIHISVSDTKGNVKGGHLLAGSLIRTTAEVVICSLDGEYSFKRSPDENTGW